MGLGLLRWCVPSQNGSIWGIKIKYHRNKKQENRKNQEQLQGLYTRVSAVKGMWHESFYEDLRNLTPFIFLLLMMTWISVSNHLFKTVLFKYKAIYRKYKLKFLCMLYHLLAVRCIKFAIWSILSTQSSSINHICLIIQLLQFKFLNHPTKKLCMYELFTPHSVFLQYLAAFCLLPISMNLSNQDIAHK